eukprot:m.53961 g.53961  ORF g.53961 m.53961 type:complete len:199 (+) comp34296_c0_seq1:464-1060(+)
MASFSCLFIWIAQAPSYRVGSMLPQQAIFDWFTFTVAETSILPPYRGSTVAASTSDVDVQQIHVKPASDSPTFGGHLPRGDKANEFHASKAWKIKLLIGVLVGGIGLSALVLILIVMADALARQRSSTDSVTSMRPPNVILSTGSSVPGGNAQVNVPKKSRKDYIGDTNCKQLPSSVHFDTQETETTEVPVMSQDTGV